MQRGSFFVKEHVLANMSFMSYAQVKVFARKGRNWIQTIVHLSFYWKRHVFTIRVQTLGPVPHCMFVSSQQRSANKAERQVLLVQSTVVFFPKGTNQGALNQALRIVTTEWGLTKQIIISSVYINRWLVGSSAWRVHCITQEWHVC